MYGDHATALLLFIPDQLNSHGLGLLTLFHEQANQQTGLRLELAARALPLCFALAYGLRRLPGGAHVL